MLLPLIVNTIILIVVITLNGVGLIVTSPLVICILRAAHRQLFGTDDQT